MKRIIADHSSTLYLKPGEVVISLDPILVSTILGSCVAVTMFSLETGLGAICHAMLPNNLKHGNDFFYVDTAVHYLHRKMIEYGGDSKLVIKLFGGAQVLAGGASLTPMQSVGEQNIRQATQSLAWLGLPIAKADTGGQVGRKLFFSMKTGDVYLRKLGLRSAPCACSPGISA